jgi:hypothetical protein
MESWRRSKGIKPREEWLKSVRNPTYCPDCKQHKSLSDFNKDNSRPLGYQNVCRKCQSIRHRKWIAQLTTEKRERRRLKNNAITRRYRQKDGYLIKRAAHDMVDGAITLGLLKRQPCEICGDKKSEAHHDDYHKPLEVRWLCRKHHAQHHS